MLVLLPPSEGKSSGGTGPAVEPGALTLPALRPARERVLAELVELCRADQDKALDALGLGPTQHGEIARNAALPQAPTRPAGEVYTGVLYDALGLATLGAAARRRAGEALLVFSGLWGAVRVGDAIPSYRCPVGARLPGLGTLAGFWRPALAEVMPEAAGDGLVLDLRSSAYAAMWRPKGSIARRTAAVRVLLVREVDGVERRGVVSHFNKATKGRLVRALLESGAEPAGVDELADCWRQSGFRVERTGDRRAGRAGQRRALSGSRSRVARRAPPAPGVARGTPPVAGWPHDVADRSRPRDPGRDAGGRGGRRPAGPGPGGGRADGGRGHVAHPGGAARGAGDRLGGAAGPGGRRDGAGHRAGGGGGRGRGTVPGQPGVDRPAAGRDAGVRSALPARGLHRVGGAGPAGTGSDAR